MATQNSAADLVDEFIEAFDARDIDAATDIVADDARAGDAFGPQEIFTELKLRSPYTSLVRADLDGEPVAVFWVPDEQSEPQPIGYVAFETDGTAITGATIHDSVPHDINHLPNAGTLVSTEPGIDGQVKNSEAPAG